MELTFVLTVVVGTPVVAVLSLFASLPTWPNWALFAVRVGAVVWLVTTLFVYGTPGSLGFRERGHVGRRCLTQTL